MSTLHPLAEDYLRRLADESKALPATEARDLADDIAEHLGAATGPTSTEADVRTVLDRLGTPADVVAAAGPARSADRSADRSSARAADRAADRPEPARWTWVETTALAFLIGAQLSVILLPVTILLWVIGLGLITSSRLWTVREKWLGALGLGATYPMLLVALAYGLRGTSGLTRTCASRRTDGDVTVVTECADHLTTVALVTWILVGLGFAAVECYVIWRLLRARQRVSCG